ncbi:LacI family DNA-binding transcriptional regulator [Cerasicoccus arenae]|nr:LacI family DNA-binding transcriptional regulator [Cerasicoccus arenae]MBK1859730.1 LacI family DNA-binding transcriptional regulator [Cerasicoccus arenae]
MSKPKAYTIRELAEVAGLSVGAVSYALRGHPSVSDATIERVRALAVEMDYRPDPRLSTLMAQIRRSQSPREREVLGWIWLSSKKISEQHFGQMVFAGAQRRAEQLGCSLEPFWLNGAGMTPKRLHKILRTRGISGILLSPEMERNYMTVDWDWSAFACAIIGMTEWSPVLHRVGHDYYRSVWISMQRMREAGLKQPAFIMSRSIDDRLHHMQLAAFRTMHPDPSIADSLIQYVDDSEKPELKPWPKDFQPDAILLAMGADDRFYRILRQCFPTVKHYFTLNWGETGVVPGICTRYDLIAGVAVDLVLAQLHRNERGIPDPATAVLLQGEWREVPNVVLGTPLKRQKPAKKKRVKKAS